MKTLSPIIICIVMISLIPQGFSSCTVNDDWSEAPCLDQIVNGKYPQEQIDMWRDYYSYKGSIFMEQKYLELSDAIKEDRLQEWVDESIIHRNVYEYYFFSGRAPNTGEYSGGFDVITVNEEGAPEYGKQTFPNLRPLTDYDYQLIIWALAVSGIIGAVVAGIVVLIRRKKR